MENNRKTQENTVRTAPPVRKRRRKRKKKTARKVAVVIMSLFLVFFAAGVIFASAIISEYTRSTSGEETVIVQIPQNSSERDIARILKANGVIDYELSFRLKMKTSPYRGQLKYGRFVLKEKMSLDEAIAALIVSTEKKAGVKVTIPEGFSIEQIAERVEDAGLVNKEDFLKEISEGEFDYEFIKHIPDNDKAKYTLQGYLFPSTHIFAADATAHEIIDTLLGEFEIQYKSVEEKLPEGMDMHEAIIRASLIEREAKLDSERATISGVIQNRLDIDKLLQIDAAVVYAISDGLYDIDRVLYKDLEIDSPYNVYKYKGLPTGPICNPGIKSIIAAMEPEEHEYLYYHTDTKKNDGSHIFTETFSQHTNS